MISDSVELLEFNFCLEDRPCITPVPNDIAPPVCPRMFGYTAYDASTHVTSVFRSLAPIILTSFKVRLMYLNSRSNFSLSFLVDRETLVHKYATIGSMSGLALLHMCRSFAVTVWNTFDCFSFNSSSFSSLLNRSYFPGVLDFPFDSSPKHSS